MRYMKTLATLGLLALISAVPAQAQSSSRNSGGGGGGGSVAPPASSFPSAPSSGFSNPSQSFPQQSFPQQTMPFGQGTVSPSFNQGGMPIQGQGAASQNAGGSPGVGASELNDQIWTQHDPNSTRMIDHSAWDYLLSRYVVTDARGVNRFNYRGMTRSDFEVLCGYLYTLQATDTRTLNKAEQLAYWFNLYNATTVGFVVAKRPLLSVRQIKTKPLDLVGPFDDKILNVMGRSLSLTDVESGIIRPVFKDPRIHYALNCASVGCPNLSCTAWTSANLDARLNRAAYDFINTDRAVKVGVFGVNASKIFDWYKADFGGSDQAVIQHMRQYANPATQRKLSGVRKFHRFYYDWSLNQAGTHSNLYGILLP